MADFTKEIIISNRQLLFSFRNIYSSKAEKYFVIVTKDSSELAKFEMVRDDHGKWKIVDPVPQWIRDAEKNVLAMVQDEHKHAYAKHRSANEDDWNQGTMLNH